MPVNMNVKIKGMKEVQKLLARYPNEAPRVFDKTIQEAGQVLRDETKALADIPVDTGFGRNSLRTRKVQQMVAAVGFPGTKNDKGKGGGTTVDEYMTYQHEGTRYIKARPFFEWALERGALAKIDALFDNAIKQLSP